MIWWRTPGTGRPKTRRGMFSLEVRLRQSHRSLAPALIVIHTLQVTRHTRREAGIQCHGWQSQIRPITRIQKDCVNALLLGMTKGVEEDSVRNVGWRLFFAGYLTESQDCKKNLICYPSAINFLQRRLIRSDTRASTRQRPENRKIRE